jgi:hypothetical protein
MNHRLKPSLNQKVHDSIRMLSLHAERAGGPQNLAQAFTDADQYPDFDNDPGANYEVGYLRGVAEAMGVDVLSLIDE